FELQHEMQKEELTSEELVQFYLNRIGEYDDSINSIITVNENVLEEAKQLDKERKAGNVRGPLHGIPVILKDNYDTYDMQTTAGSLSLEGSI
ncbi:amidase family protein, partial [Escherichia coli]|nr:amidase family protein [Escherichia coli]